MRSEPGKLASGVDLAGVHLTGMVEGDAIVRQGGEAIVDGMVTGSLTVGPGCVVLVNGTITGDLESYGTTEVAGVVDGNVIEKHGGEVKVAAGAVIGRRLIRPSH